MENLPLDWKTKVGLKLSVNKMKPKVENIRQAGVVEKLVRSKSKIWCGRGGKGEMTKFSPIQLGQKKQGWVGTSCDKECTQAERCQKRENQTSWF